MINKFTSFILNNSYLFLFYLLLTLFTTTIFKDIAILNILLKLSLIWGLIISIYNIIKIILRKPNKIELSIFIFLIFQLIITILKYNSIENIKTWIINLVLMTGIFYINTTKSKSTLSKELNLISTSYCIIMFILSLCSCVLFFTKKNIILNDIIYGLNNGLFVNKNSFGIASGIALLLSIYCFNNKSSIIKNLYLINILLQLTCLLIAKGRSAYLLILSIPLVFIFIILKNKLIRWLLISIPTIWGVITFILFNEKLSVFLSGRADLWISAFLVVKNNLLFGIGSENLVDKVISVRPNITLLGIEFGGLHNIFIQILTTNGIIILILFLIVLLSSILFIINKIDDMNYLEKSSYLIILSLLIGLILVNLFESNLIYIISFISISFWGILGLLLSYLKK